MRDLPLVNKMPYILVGGGGAKMGYFWPFGANFGRFWPENKILGPKTGIFGIFGWGPKLRNFGNIFTSATARSKSAKVQYTLEHSGEFFHFFCVIWFITLITYGRHCFGSFPITFFWWSLILSKLKIPYLMTEKNM